MKISHLVWCSLLAVSSLAAQNLQVAPMVQPPSGTIQVVPQVKKPEAKALQAQAPLVTKITVEAEAVKAKAAPSVQPVVKNRQALKPFAVAPNGQGKGLPLAPAAPQAMQSVKVQPGLMPSALLPGTAATKSTKAEEADEVPSLVYLGESFTVPPLPANPGCPLEIKATIKNTGSNAYTGRLYAALVTLDGEGSIISTPYISGGTDVGLPAGQQQELTLVRWSGTLQFRLPLRWEFRGQIQTPLAQTTLDPDRELHLALPLTWDKATSLSHQSWNGSIREREGPFLSAPFYLDWWGGEFAFSLSDGRIVASSPDACTAWTQEFGETASAVP